VPVACEEGAPASPDASPRVDLSALFPAVEEKVGIGEAVRFGYQSPDDSFELRGEVPADQDWVEDGDVELVVTVDGVEHTAPIPAGSRPELSPQTVASRGAPGFLVNQSGGDASVATLYAFWNGELRPIEPPAGVFLGSGVVDHQGEITEQRTWVTTQGALFTAVLLDPGAGRHQVWRWSDDFGETMARETLGEVCIDWVTNDASRCP
jgi:hypothetical protein